MGHDNYMVEINLVKFDIFLHFQIDFHSVVVLVELIQYRYWPYRQKSHITTES